MRAPTNSRDPHWSQGIVVFSNAVLLLVTLDKTGRKNYQYDDRFQREMFWWQSQDRQSQKSAVIGRILSGALHPYLFVRIHEKRRGITQPFVFCGRLSEPDAEGDRPVTIQFTSADYLKTASGPLRMIYSWRPQKAASRRERARKAKITRRHGRGQGRQMDQEVRDATEKHAMEAAHKLYFAREFAITDTHANQPYDYVVSKGTDTRRVEVKGTQGAGEYVELTRGEVEAARMGPQATDLFILHSISITRAYGILKVSGGKIRLLRDWVPSDRHLRPTRFTYAVPRLKVHAQRSDQGRAVRARRKQSASKKKNR